jgi:hypothetical protein
MAGKNTEGAKVQAPETTTENKKAGKNTEGAKKVYKFTSENKYLSCFALGIQFVNGVATTDNLAVAKELVKIKGVELIEE